MILYDKSFYLAFTCLTSGDIAMQTPNWAIFIKKRRRCCPKNVVRLKFLSREYAKDERTRERERESMSEREKERESPCRPCTLLCEYIEIFLHKFL